jgi:hypothetical protein
VKRCEPLETLDFRGYRAAEPARPAGFAGS